VEERGERETHATGTRANSSRGVRAHHHLRAKDDFLQEDAKWLAAKLGGQLEAMFFGAIPAQR
jgi:hypothetical protein